MTRLAQADTFHACTTVLSFCSRQVGRVRNHLARTDAALEGQSLQSAIHPETRHDTGPSADVLTGTPTHDPDLPFFLQSGFGRRDK